MVIWIFIAVAWLWFQSVVPVNAESFGYDLPPLLLLGFVVARFHKKLVKDGKVSILKTSFGYIFCACASCALIDIFRPADTHKLGAVICVIFFGSLSAFMLVIAAKANRKSSQICQSPDSSVPAGE
ncbi:MAG TPA: hypothetical protein VNU94_10135 [Acidobacteriaceae bacterium]|jgi:hypothetical protein|nr:hypothetical protein [Acidobacteriaceae bacterium]